MSTQPGTYTGKDGREYRVRPDFDNDAFEVQVWLPGLHEWRDTFLRMSDITAAKAALDALVEAESGEWVLLPAPNQEEPYIRISLDGQRVQERSQEGRWNDYDAWWIKAAYRKGRSVAQQESADLRDAARELVAAVRRYKQAVGAVFRKWDADARGHQSEETYFNIHDLDCCCCPEHVEFQRAEKELCAAAKTLEGKL